MLAGSKLPIKPSGSLVALALQVNTWFTSRRARTAQQASLRITTVVSSHLWDTMPSSTPLRLSGFLLAVLRKQEQTVTLTTWTLAIFWCSIFGRWDIYQVTMCTRSTNDWADRMTPGQECSPVMRYSPSWCSTKPLYGNCISSRPSVRFIYA